MENETIDVTLLALAEKHPFILAQFGKLLPGECITISNDHDPKPLYYQLMAEYGNQIRWRYKMKGPTTWIVAITRLEKLTSPSVGEIAAADYRQALVFKEFGIDFCCGGKKSIAQACADKHVDINVLTQALEATVKTPSMTAPAFDTMPLDALADYIVEQHHTYINTTREDLLFYAEKVARVHGNEHPELHTINQLTQQLLNELKSHMAKEERILFPYVKQLQHSAAGAAYGPFSTVAQPIHMMEMEHELAGEYLAEIRKLTGEYILPADACNSYRVLYDMLQALESDLNIHIHLENNILFPRAMDLETTL